MPYPANLEIEADTHVANWRPVAQWVMGLPHLIVASALQQVGELVSVVGWFAIVFTGRLPAGLADFQCLVIRYSARAYSYAAWLREEYPAFEFPFGGADPDTDPVRVDLVPALEDRDRLTVGLRFIWVIPAALYGAVLGIAAVGALVVSFFAVVLTGQWPGGLQAFVIRSGRYLVRLSAYAMLLTDEYPPLALE